MTTENSESPCRSLTGAALFNARTLALIPHINIRLIDAERSSVSDIGYLKLGTEEVWYWEIYAKVSKNKEPVHVRAPLEGYLKTTAQWARQHVKELLEQKKPYLFRQHDAPHGSARDFTKARGWKGDEVLKKDHLVFTFYEILRLPPVNMSRTTATLRNIKPHGCRHAALAVVRAYKWPRYWRNEFGTWKSTAADDERLAVSRTRVPTKSCSTMSDAYSRNTSALNNGCQRRIKLIRSIQDFIGAAEWVTEIPVTFDYGFLPMAGLPDRAESSEEEPLHDTDDDDADDD